MSEWRSIPGYEATYRVSDTGEVWSIPRPRTKGGALKIKLGKRGYPAVALVQGGRQVTREVHRLVALAFLGRPMPGQEVRHLDGNPLNPSLTNLAYGSRSENRRDRLRHGTDHNAAKTHCPQNHPYDEANTLRIPSRPTVRYCRTCNEQRRRARLPDYRQEWA